MAIGQVVKHYARRAGLDPAEFGGHSLRAGFITSAAERGHRAERIADHTGHRSLAVLRAYVRRVDAFESHLARGCSKSLAFRRRGRPPEGKSAVGESYARRL